MHKYKSDIELPAAVALFLVLVVIGLHIAESGLNELLGKEDLFLFNLKLGRNGDAIITLLGLEARVGGSLALGMFRATPEAITFSRDGNTTRVSLKFYIPESHLAIRRIESLVLRAAEMGFAASRAICKWLESRTDISQ